MFWLSSQSRFCEPLHTTYVEIKNMNHGHGYLGLEHSPILSQLVTDMRKSCMIYVSLMKE